MKLISVEALVIRIPRGWNGVDRVTAFPTRRVCPAIGGDALETVLARVSTDTGLTGWGESQALTASNVTGAIIQSILKPLLENREFDGTGIEIEAFWNAMYNQMRVCGQTGGFMLDAIAALDIALWDLAGKIHHAPVSTLIAQGAKTRLDTYVNYLPGDTREEWMAQARTYREAGCRRFKLFLNASERELLEDYDSLAAECGSENIAVDAQWRLDGRSAAAFGAELDRRGALWLECPFAPEEPARHAALAAHMRTPLAIGESYRTHFELAPFFRAGAMGIVQPDLGRCGITEALRIAHLADRAGMDIVPHLSPSLGPLLFATLQFAAAVPNCRLVPHTPGLVETVSDFSTTPVIFRDGRYTVPSAPGLGIELVEPEIRQVAVA